MLSILVSCIMAVVLSIYIVIVPIYFYSVQKSMYCKYALESAKREHKDAFWKGFALLIGSTVVFLFVAIVVETVSR